MVPGAEGGGDGGGGLGGGLGGSIGGGGMADSYRVFLQDLALAARQQRVAIDDHTARIGVSVKKSASDSA